MTKTFNTGDWLSVSEFILHHQKETKQAKPFSRQWVYGLISGRKYKTRKGKEKTIKPAMKVNSHYIMLGDKPFVHKDVRIHDGKVRGGAK